MARAGRSPTSCSCRRRSSPTPTRRSCRSRCSATSWSITARAAGTASRSLLASGAERRGHHELRRRAGPRQLGRARRSAWRGGLRPVRRGPDGVRRLRRRSRRRRACTRRTGGSSTRRSTRASSRWFERAAALARRDPGRRRAAPARRRLQRRRRRPTTSGTRRAPTAGRTCPSRSAPRSAALRDWGLTDAYRKVQPATRPVHAGGTTGPGCSIATRACGSTCCWRRCPSRTGSIWAEIDREARKGPPIPSDHAPVVDGPRRRRARRSTRAGRARCARIAARTRPRKA